LCQSAKSANVAQLFPRDILLVHGWPFKVLLILVFRTQLAQQHVKRGNLGVETNTFALQVSGVDDPFVSPVHGLISRTVLERFRGFSMLQDYDLERCRSSIVDVLNLFYVFANVFDPRFVNLAVPFVVALVPLERDHADAGSHTGGGDGNAVSGGGARDVLSSGIGASSSSGGRRSSTDDTEVTIAATITIAGGFKKLFEVCDRQPNNGCQSLCSKSSTLCLK
jgi:hypothetical protein